MIDAREAERIGLVNEVVPSGTCLQRAVALADTIVARTPPRSRPASPARSKQLPSESSLPDGRAAFACCSPARGRYSATLSLTKGSAVSDNSRAYNSVWQLRTDAWCRLEEASERLTKPTTNGELKEEYVTICRDLLATLTPLEPYWAHPGTPQFSRVQRLFTAGSYDKFAHAVARINRALTTESYRTGEVEHAGLDEHDMFGADPRQLEHQPVTKRDQPYFEVLVVESMTEAQERALRKEVRSWRRPDDEFVYELVVVASGDEAQPQ